MWYNYIDTNNIKYTKEQIGRMINILNGFDLKSAFGDSHLKKYPEKKEQIVRDYEMFIDKYPKHLITLSGLVYDKKTYE